ncbi:MAG: ABC transporter substrate-binding protein [candidate division WOR-3 bacterium]|nr:MAG: ABC transporter substrate-binding protein [candidate division WOR-3 bacterium]
MSIKSKERLLTILIIFAFAGLLLVIGYPIYKESLPSQVTFGVDKSFLTLPFYVAMMDTTRNYFAMEKVQAELVEVVGDPLEGLKRGDYDVAVVPWYWLMISPSSNGDTVKAFGALEIKSGRSLDAVIVPPKSRITRLRDVSGKRIGYRAGDEYFINLIMTKMTEDLNLKGVKYVPMSGEELLRAFDEKTADVLYLLDPYRAYMLQQGNTALAEGLSSTYVVPNIPYGAVVMRKNFVTTEHRLAAIRVKTAVEATLSYLARNPEVAKSYVLRLNNIPDEGELITRMRTPEYERLAEINVKSIENLQTELVRRGIGTCGIKPSEFLFAKTDFVR